MSAVMQMGVSSQPMKQIEPEVGRDLDRRVDQTHDAGRESDGR